MPKPTPTKKLGRPLKLTPELETVLYREIAEGKTIKEACKAAGISFQSVAVRRADDEAFRDRLARAYLHGSVFSLDDAEHGLRTATAKNIMVRREVAFHARWRASRLLPAFRDKLSAEVVVDNRSQTDKENAVLEVARSVQFLGSVSDDIRRRRAGQALLPAPSTPRPSVTLEASEEAARAGADVLPDEKARRYQVAASENAQHLEEEEAERQRLRDDAAYEREIAAQIRQQQARASRPSSAVTGRPLFTPPRRPWKR